MAMATKKLLADGLKELLKKKTLDKITVKELVQHCGVNRQTFYYNFQDIYELLEWIFTEEGARLLRETAGMECWQDRVAAIFQELSREENKSLVLNAFYSVNSIQLDRFMQNYLRSLIEEVISRETKDIPLTPEDRDFMIRLYVVLCEDLIVRWVIEGMESDMSDDMARLMRVMSGSATYMARSLLGTESN